MKNEKFDENRRKNHCSEAENRESMYAENRCSTKGLNVPRSNFERIKNMSLDEMARFFGADLGADSVAACSAEFCPYYDDENCNGKGPDRCVEAYAHWLESEVTDDSETNKV